jgi:WD40 repeat protein
VTWSRDGTRLIGGGQDGTLTIWDAVTRQQVSRLMAHSSRVLGVAFAEDGNTLVSLSLDSLRLWHAPSSAEIRVED